MPVYLVYPYYALKSWNMSFIGAVNPNLYLGGLWDYSKYKAQERLSKKYLPKTVLVKELNPETLEKTLKTEKLHFPLIIKPDHGERGRGVLFIRSWEEFRNYLPFPKGAGYLIQEFIDLPLEAGILYSRSKKESKGCISSLMIREYLNVLGDGKSTIQELVMAHPRYSKHIASLKKYYEKDLHNVLERGQPFVLEPIGNHNRGTIFRNANSLISPEMIKLFDLITKQIPDFHFGRIDVKMRSMKSLESGEDLKVIEINGVNSEPAHIYDPDYSLVAAWKDLINNWKRIYKISKDNRQSGVSYPNSNELRWSFVRRLKGKPRV